MPLVWGVIRGPSFCEAGYMVLDHWIEPLAKLEDDVGTLEVASPLYYFVKIVDVLIDMSSTLEELHGFEFGP
jgi:hypothetical protein